MTFKQRFFTGESEFLSAHLNGTDYRKISYLRVGVGVAVERIVPFLMRVE